MDDEEFILGRYSAPIPSTSHLSPPASATRRHKAKSRSELGTASSRGGIGNNKGNKVKVCQGIGCKKRLKTPAAYVSGILYVFGSLTGKRDNCVPIAAINLS
jgi:hypothetical protein